MRFIRSLQRIGRLPQFSNLVLVLSLLCYIGLFHTNLVERLPYPPKSDQTMYLAGGQQFAEEHLFFWRSPLYSLWMGIFYISSGHDPKVCFYLEKYVSMALLGVAIAYLGKRLFDFRTGLLMGIWALNCKYLVIETNGSHVFAAVLFTASLISLTLANKNARLPFAVLLLLLSTQARSEMWIPFAVFAGVVMALYLKSLIGQKRSKLMFNLGSGRYWVISLVIGASFFLLFSLRMGPPESHRFSEAFAMNFAMNYADRCNLRPVSRGDELDWMGIWVKVFPGVSSSAGAIREDRGEIHPFKAVTRYPREVLAHIRYNLKLFVRALPATILAFDRRFLAAAVLMIYLISYVIWKGNGAWQGSWSAFLKEDRCLIAALALAIFTLIPVSFILRVVSRYYLQLMPTLMISVVIVLRAVARKLNEVRAN